MNVASVLLELYGRLPPLVHEAVDGLDPEDLIASPSGGSNSIAWLVWHSARVQDHHVSELLGAEQIWTTSDWAKQFSLSPDPSNTGYGHSAPEVAAVRPVAATALVDFFDAVYARTCEMLEDVTSEDLDRVVDRRWDPPVTLGVRLISIADDSLQHLGQAAYVRGMLRR
jgi:hypothetical protein